MAKMSDASSTSFTLDSLFGMRYTSLLRPSDGMADVTVSKTVVETRVGSNPTSGTT